MLEIEELEELIEVIQEEIRKKVYIANRTNTLDEFLSQIGLNQYIQNSNSRLESYRSGKIVVIGAPTVKEKNLIGIAKKLGIDKNRFEFCLDYEKSQKYPYEKLKGDNYRVVLVGAIPHSTNGKGDSSSIITELENNNDYPRIIRLLSNDGELKITKTNFEDALKQLLCEEYI